MNTRPDHTDGLVCPEFPPSVSDTNIDSLSPRTALCCKELNVTDCNAPRVIPVALFYDVPINQNVIFALQSFNTVNDNPSVLSFVNVAHVESSFFSTGSKNGLNQEAGKVV